MAILATPAKLKTGEWGARVAFPVKPGDELTVKASNGKSWPATVGRVAWTDGKVSLCATVKNGYRAGGETGRCKECGKVIRDADHHRAMGGLCGHCAFDEFDM